MGGDEGEGGGTAAARAGQRRRGPLQIMGQTRFGADGYGSVLVDVIGVGGGGGGRRASHIPKEGLTRATAKSKMQRTDGGGE